MKLSDDDFKERVLEMLSKHGGMLTTLTGDTAELKRDVAGLKSDVAGLKSDVARLNVRVDNLERDSCSRFSRLRRELVEFRSDFDNFKVTTTMQLGAHDEQIRDIASSIRAFESYVTQSFKTVLRHLENHEIRITALERKVGGASRRLATRLTT